MTAVARRRSVIEGRVKVMWNCSIVVIYTWFVSILCPLLSLLCHITNHINTGLVANSFICSLLDKFLSVLQHFFRRYKLNHIQTLHSLCLWKRTIIIIGNTIEIIITIINFASHGKLKGVVITLHHKSHVLWEWLLSWKRLSWDTEVKGKGNCPYSMDKWNEWSPEEPFGEKKRDTTSVKYSSMSKEGQRNDFLEYHGPLVSFPRHTSLVLI